MNMKLNNIPDANERIKALDPHKSFIVQAPAGSGKTELLTQRFLKLLSYVNSPEEILAITFTKKSANEMRARIINALQIAEHSSEPESAHEKLTWQLAKNVLARDQKLIWSLLSNPNRLRLQTMDSFNSTLTKQLPILSQFGATPDITDYPQPLYRQAIQELLSHLEENLPWSNAIAQLLLHLDNDLNQVESLLISMLEKRDQWLPYLACDNPEFELRELLESHLKNVNAEMLSNFYRTFPNEYFSELKLLMNYAKVENTPCAIANLLLTKDSSWRKKFTKTEGFPSESQNEEEKKIFSEMKERILKLIDHISAKENIKHVLTEMQHAPALIYQEPQWQTLNALHQVLRLAVAQLKLVFQTHGKIDYIENAQAALTALGTAEFPTDLALALDYQIKHILVDEFQDTSHSQFRLIEKLIAEWDNTHHRTLFLVGDPMQSIYRFREAEVGLFIRAKKNGIGAIKLEPITLAVNFRSTPAIVNWVNEHFKIIFPKTDDIATGAVSHVASIAHHPEENDSTVSLNTFMNEEDITQAKSIAAQIKAIQKKNSNESIAILVRGRTHLQKIIPTLKLLNIAYQAIDIDQLESRPAIQDILALTRALFSPADRIAWLTILRAPWCGLTLDDLFHIAGKDPHALIIERINSEKVHEELSANGRKRLHAILPILNAKCAERFRYSPRDWIESTWLLLGGPATLEQPSDLEDVHAYLQLIEKLTSNGEMISLSHLEESIHRLFAKAKNHSEQCVQIMTIHNAKGLEFDHVLLPHLEKKSPYDQKQLLLWIAHPNNTLLLAPIFAADEKPDSIYNYIKYQKNMKSDFEVARLLYVAATRAKKSLHLFFNVEAEDEKIKLPAGNSLLAALWCAISKENLLRKKSDTISVSLPETEKAIKRLKSSWKNPVTEMNLHEQANPHDKNPSFKLSEHHPKYIGIMIHSLLQQISLSGIEWFKKLSLEKISAYLKTRLIQLGMMDAAIPDAVTTIHRAIQNTLNDTRGQWILSPQREAQSEYPLTAIINGKIHSFILDRTFVDENNVRWIIDYKNSLLEKNDLEKYKMQLMQYHHAMRAFDAREIKLGLYFPLSTEWTEIIL